MKSLEELLKEFRDEFLYSGSKLYWTLRKLTFFFLAKFPSRTRTLLTVTYPSLPQTRSRFNTKWILLKFVPHKRTLLNRHTNICRFQKLHLHFRSVNKVSSPGFWSASGQSSERMCQRFPLYNYSPTLAALFNAVADGNNRKTNSTALNRIWNEIHSHHAFSLHCVC